MNIRHESQANKLTDVSEKKRSCWLTLWLTLLKRLEWSDDLECLYIYTE